MKISEKGTKKFTESEKLNIIKEVKVKGLKATLLKYDLFPATYYYWKSNKPGNISSLTTCNPIEFN